MPPTLLVLGLLLPLLALLLLLLPPPPPLTQPRPRALPRPLPLGLLMLLPAVILLLLLLLLLLMPTPEWPVNLAETAIGAAYRGEVGAVEPPLEAARAAAEAMAASSALRRVGTREKEITPA